MANETATPAKKSDLYPLKGVLLGDVEVKQANTQTGPKPYALVKVEGKGKKVTTIMTFVAAGIKVLEGKKAGEAIDVYGTYTKGDKGQTFSAMGNSVPKAKKVAAPSQEM